MNEAQALWLADLLLEGAPIADIEARMVEGGLSSEEANAEIEATLRSPIFRAARPKVQLGQRMAMAAQLHLDVCDTGKAVPRRSGLSAKRFYSDWLDHHQPVVMEGFAADWPAMNWTPSSVLSTFGDSPIELLRGRESAPHPDRSFRQLKQRMTATELLRALDDNASGNDLYLVARNHLMQRPEAAGLLVDLAISEDWVSRATLQGCCSLWIGPEGTKTSLHHDTCHAIFVQLYGRKSFRLASPLNIQLMLGAQAYYHRHRSMSDAELDGGVVETILGPGDALYLPVGYWHEAESLDLNIGISFNGLHRSNRFDDYVPGAL